MVNSLRIPLVKLLTFSISKPKICAACWRVISCCSKISAMREASLTGSSVHSMQNQSQKTAEGLIYIRHKLQILEIFTKIASLPCSLILPVPSFRLVI
jgi:hypothetical protein